MVGKRLLSSRESSFERVVEQVDGKSRRGLLSLARTVSPPPALKKRKGDVQQNRKSATAAVEAGEKGVEDYLAFYSAHLLAAIRPSFSGAPRIDHTDWVDLYTRNAGSLKGCHFVVHQHDHPIAGTHYDLRLQCNPTSSISFAIMYGLPGNPNSRRLNRNATETRVHCLWNHLIETASYSTGSMLIWDSGEYEVLPYSVQKDSGDDTEDSEFEGGPWLVKDDRTEQEKLKAAFQRRKIKLRLHGTRLPLGYTLALRLTKTNYRNEQPNKPSRRRRRQAPVTGKKRNPEVTLERKSSIEDRPSRPRRSVSSLSRLATSPPSLSANSNEAEETKDENAIAVASDHEDEVIRANNAYTGAINNVDSVHQRKWFLSIDRNMSGFVKQARKSASGFVETTWTRKSAEQGLARGIIDLATGFGKFVVGGRETEQSVVTGRLAHEILADEGVVGYIPRGLWRPITE